MSVKNKKRHLHLITHAYVASFNTATKHINKADWMQKTAV